MQVSEPNNVKVYNLTAGKSLPEWLSERKRRVLLKKNVDIRRRIELIQDFEMPGVSSCVQISKDGQYVLATGIYKPRVKCFDVNNLSLKFERCFDSESVRFEILSDDYSKLVFLQCDRYVEFHAAHGRYYRLRIPKFGRDMRYHHPSCDLFLVGASPDIYRLNLERGQFMAPFRSSTDSSSVNRCDINEIHHLLFCGTQEGKVEAWDPRCKASLGTLDCAFNCMTAVTKRWDCFPSVSALKFDSTLTLGVGTATGQILLYDIRSNKPFCIKDHLYGLPIKDIDFHYQGELVYSMDSSVLKIWDKNNGKLFTSIETSVDFNNLCVVPNSGLFFIANENPKILTYYVPSLGPAPKWAGFLDLLTEELEESNTEIVYDDYKFITQQELENLGLEHLIGSNLLRAYMHGYFLDVRLYRKAKAVCDPFEFEVYRKRKIRETIEQNRANRVQANKLPKVNKDLAQKLLNVPKIPNIKTRSVLEDDRFRALFENPSFEIDKNADEYRLLNPVLSHLDKTKVKQLKKKLLSTQQFQSVEKTGLQETEDRASTGHDERDESDTESSDDDRALTVEMKKQYRIIGLERRQKGWDEDTKQPETIELGRSEESSALQMWGRKLNRSSLGERLQKEDVSVKLLGSVGNRQMTFATNSRGQKNKAEKMNCDHKEERKKLARRGIVSTKHVRGGKRYC